MVMLLKTKMKNVLVVFGVVILTFVPVLTDLAMTGRVGALSKACENSRECREAAQREEEANKKASEASNSASLFQAKVTELSLQPAPFPDPAGSAPPSSGSGSAGSRCRRPSAPPSSDPRTAERWYWLPRFPESDPPPAAGRRPAAGCSAA